MSIGGEDADAATLVGGLILISGDRDVVRRGLARSCHAPGRAHGDARNLESAVRVNLKETVSCCGSDEHRAPVGTKGGIVRLFQPSIFWGGDSRLSWAGVGCEHPQW